MKVKTFLIDIICTITNSVITILMFCNIFYDKAILPAYDANTEEFIGTKTFYYPITPYERMSQMHASLFVILTFVLFGFALVLSIHSIFKENKVLLISKKVLYLVSSFVLVLILIASSIQIACY